MHLRNPVDLVSTWLDASLLLVIGGTGVILIVLGLKRDDLIRPIFLLAGIALMAVGFGGQFLGWSFGLGF